jgi:FHS family L-fucose permease-like MFS transporter
VAANPYVTILGPAEGAERRLNFAQSFNAGGAVLSPILGRIFILTSAEFAPAQIAAMSSARLETYRGGEAGAVKGPYLMTAGVFIVIAVLIQFAHLPGVQEAALEEDAAEARRKAGSVLAHGHFGVIAQFF